MKSLIRSFVVNLAALEIAIFVIPGLTNRGGAKTIVLAIIILGVMNLFIRPIISLVFLPINLLTLGTFRWLVNVVVLFLLTLIVTDLRIASFFFPGIEYQGFIIPALEISPFWTLVLTSLTISTTNAFLFWLSTDE